MAIFDRWSLTRKGMALITKAQAEKCNIHFVRLDTGNGVWDSDENIQYATSLKATKQSFTFSNIDIPDGNPSTVVLEAVINNLNLKELYYLREMGVFATDPNEGTILYAIATAEKDTTYIPANNGVGISTITERINIEVANAGKVTIEATGAVVAATDFLAIKAKVEDLTECIAGGTKGQHLIKEGPEDYNVKWKDFKPVVVDKRENFPATGETNSVYIDKSSSSVYVWDSGSSSYIKLALGADAAENLQEQVTKNKEAITAADGRIKTLETAVEKETLVTVSKNAWTESTESGTTVYTNSVTVAGLTEDSNIIVWPNIISTVATDIVAEQKALGTMFSRGRAFADTNKLVLKCYGKKPSTSFGLRLQGVEATS